MSAAMGAIEIQSANGALAHEVKDRGGASPMNCLQCRKCSSGCPVAAGADLQPHEVVRLVQMDQRDEVLASRFIWACTSCQTCSTRCPQNVDPAAMMDALRAMSREARKTTAATAVPVFNEIFLEIVRRRGRMYEIALMAEFKLRTLRLLDDVSKAPLMLWKGKLPLVAPRAGGRTEREEMFDRAAAGGVR
jgi:heterodisulfide reductase subunit C